MRRIKDVAIIVGEGDNSRHDMRIIEYCSYALVGKLVCSSFMDQTKVEGEERTSVETTINPMVEALPRVQVNQLIEGVRFEEHSNKYTNIISFYASHQAINIT